jgi:methylglutaconyl-CoA hydratase
MQLGLIHDVVDKMQLDNKISTTIDNLLKNSPAAMYSSKQLVQDVAYHPINSALIRRTCKRIVTAKLSKQGQEGLSAFLEKRKPNWQQEN